jgi:TrmH family RNA methyltransferase
VPLPDGSGTEYTSVRSPRLKAARRLTKRALRQRARAFLAEGPQAVTEAFASGAPVSELFVTAEARVRHAGLVAEMARSGIAVYTVSGEVMAELAQTVTPQGLLAVCGFIDVPLDQALAGGTGEAGASHPPGPPSLVAVLASVRDPGNAGTVLRAADAAGAGAVLFSDASVDPYNGKAVRASAGSLFHLPLVAGVRLEHAASALRAAGLRILAADARGGRTLDDLSPDELAAPAAWIFGNEAWGMPEPVLALADGSVAVPIYGRAESLNLATAAAVCLYASARAQRANSASTGHLTKRLRLWPFARVGAKFVGVRLSCKCGHARVSSHSVTRDRNGQEWVDQ